MRYEGLLNIPAPKEDVYSLITDPKRLIPMIPDVVGSKVLDADHFSVSTKVGIGPLRGTLDFAFAVEAKAPGSSARLTGKGKGLQSTVDLVLSMSLKDAPAGCATKWVADVNIGGMLASVGSRLIAGTTEKYVKQVTGNLAKAYS